MKKYIYYEPSGRINFTANKLIQNSFSVLEIEDTDLEGEAFLHYVRNGELKKMPEPASQYLQFDYEKESWVAPDDLSLVLTEIRSRRDRLLQESDWTQLPDVPLATKAAWATYRQALRDITLQPNPFSIAWPVAPG